ncbi:hypothetical protein RB608_18180 [Nocardioides sp. LHD-245]|uniref:hypothetical protein n=1 Tax=Nocardioides sp. LHD-245 TaxID=3051387 RepID=UPI0027E0913F|nr:hypothetical protein [Nocardioides sp. LHD-245]
MPTDKPTTKRPTRYVPAAGPQGARINLSRFVRERADQTAERFGFGRVPTSDAPSTSQQLRGAFAHSKATGDPLPISNLFCDDTIYLEPEDNVAFRFWHDVSHCHLGLSFSLPDEWELAVWHLNALAAAGLGPGTREHELFRADVLGQVILLGVAGRFPFNQGEFTRTCINLGLDEGILTELRRVEAAS